MRKMVTGLIFGLLFLILGGMILPMIFRMRTDQNRLYCKDHLREIGIGLMVEITPNLLVANKKEDEFPAATIFLNNQPPDNRLSWLVPMLGNIELEKTKNRSKPQKTKKILEGEIADNKNSENPKKQMKSELDSPRSYTDLYSKIDWKMPWDTPENKELFSKKINVFLCPGNPAFLQQEKVNSAFGLTQYVGLGGIGERTPFMNWKESKNRAGVFCYDEPTPLKAITDGLSQTMAVIETDYQLGSWSQGGTATLRTITGEEIHYLGGGLPFGGNHPDGTNILFADMSVHYFNYQTDAKLFRSLITISGSEDSLKD